MRPLLALALVAGLAGCGGDPESEAPPAQSGGRLQVEVRPQGPDGPVQRREVSCPEDPVCAELEPADFEPVPDDRVCTQIYGGPATARVTGELDGQPIHARFSRTNGCEIARWDRLAPLLGQVRGPAPPP